MITLFFVYCVCKVLFFYCLLFFFSSRRRHTRCALVTGVQTCALPILDAGRSTPVSLRALRHSSRHEWLVAGCLLVLLALVASAIAGGMPNAELIPAQLQATLGQGDGASSISADGQALLVNGGPGATVARMHFTLPARTVHGAPWVVRSEEHTS